MNFWFSVKCLAIVLYSICIFVYCKRFFGIKIGPKSSAAIIILYEVFFCYIVLDRVLKLNYFASAFLSQAGFIIIILLLFKGDLIKKLAISTLLLVIRELTSYAVITLFTRIADLWFFYLRHTEAPLLFVNIIYIISCFIGGTLLLVISKKYQYLCETLPRKISFMLLIPSAFIILILWFAAYALNYKQLFYTLYLIEGSSLPPVIMQLVDAVLLFILSVMGLAADIVIVINANSAVRQLLSDQFNTLQLTYYENLLNQNQKFKAVKHDIRNHITAVKSLLNENHVESAKEYLNQLTDEGMFSSNNIRTGNSIADAVISSKLNAAEKANISFICDMKFPPNNPMDNFDLCIVIGNALDNAINACTKDTSSNLSKFIKVQSAVLKSYFLMDFKNSICSDAPIPIVKSINRLSANDHGLGLYSIKSIVDKYSGTMDISLDNNTFSLSIMMPL